MTIRELHWDIKQKVNKLDSDFKKDLSPIELDNLINTVTFDYVQMFAYGNNLKKYKLGFENSQQRIDMLSTLVIGEPKQPTLSADVTSTNTLEYYLDSVTGSLVEPYQHLIRANITHACGKAKVTLVSHDNLDYALDDFNRRSSARWGRVIGCFKASSNSAVESSLYLYPQGEFENVTLQVEYIKKPTKVFLGTYDSIEYLQCVAVGGPT